jgi:hypothetical protein
MSILDSIDYAAFGMIQPGARVVLTEGVSFYDKGDRGTVLHNGVDEAACTAYVQFEGGAKAYLPIFALAVEPREFRIRTGRRIRAVSYATEAEAADAAEERGLLAFDVVEVQHTARYTVTQLSDFTQASPPASTHPDACIA